MLRRRAIEAIAPTGFPREFIFRLVRGVVILLFFLVVVLGGAAAFLTYRVVTARNDSEPVTPATYLLSNYISLNFTDRAGGEHEGWLLLGLRGAPVIILCHGYNSNRSELLSLGTVLRENHFNVYLFNFDGSKVRENYSDLGLRPAANLLSAIDALTKQTGVNARRVGLFGVNLGGYAALRDAEDSPKVKALVVDTIYETPDQMFETQIDRVLGGSSPLFRFLAEAEFHLLTFGHKPVPVRRDLSRLEKMPKLFISGRDMPPLSGITEELYNLAPQPKQLLILEHSQPGLSSGSEKKEYENQVLNFFLQNLSLRAD
jgi:pimeloyl-ACP methyl ester carboxylesterase